MSSPISTLAADLVTYPPIMLFDIVSVEDGTALHLSQMPITYGGNTYLPYVLSVSGFEVALENSPLGIMAIPDISITLGDVSGGMVGWDNAHYFKGATLTATLIFYNPTTKTAASSDTRTIFKGICNAPDSVSPTAIQVSAFSRFNAEFLLLPTARVSQFSQTTFPGNGAQDCDDANATGSGPANPSSAGYAWFHAASHLVGGFPVPVIQPQDAYLPYLSCGYGPLRGSSGFGSSGPLGNFVVPSAIATAGLCAATAIGNSGASYPASNGLQNHIVVITSGTGVGQERRIVSNTTIQIVVGNPFTTIPDGTSHFCVLFGYCGQDMASCQARGMFSTDSSSRVTDRNNGITYVPFANSTTIVNKHQQVNPDYATYNQPIPLIYGTVMVNPPEVFSLTSNFNRQFVRGQYLIGLGPMQNVSNFVVGGTLVPFQANSVYNANLISTGAWTDQIGIIGETFTDPFFPAADPKSGICIVFAKYPPQFVTGVAGGGSIQVQVTGMPLWQCDSAGNLSQYFYSAGANPAWIILDILQRAGWKTSEIDLPSFYAFSVYANQQIALNISSTQSTLAARFSLSISVTQQTPASELLRSVLGACHGLLSYDTNGLLRLDCENRITNTTLAGNVTAGVFWATAEDGAGITIGTELVIDTGASQETVTVTNVQLSSNNFQFEATFAHFHYTGAAVAANPAYAFSLSSIALDGKNTPQLTRTSLKTHDTPNEYVVNFQDSLRAYVVDSVNLLNTQEANNFGAAVIGQLQGVGMTTVDATTRIAQLALYKSHGRRDAANDILSRGNLFAALTSSIKAVDVGIGKIATITYGREGWVAKPFRVVSLSPTPSGQFPYWKIKLTLREHDDGWYDDINGNIDPTPGSVPDPSPPRSPFPRGHLPPDRLPLPSVLFN